jgi:hypothetical protein
MVELYLHSPIRLHGVVLNKLITRTTLPFFFLSFLYNGSSRPFRAQASYLVPLSFYTVGRTPWTGDQPVARPLPKHRTTQTQNKRIHVPNIHVLSGIRTHDPNVRASESSSCLRPRGYRDRLYPFLPYLNNIFRKWRVVKLPTMKSIAKPRSIGQRNGVARIRKGVDSGIDPTFFRILGRRAKLATALEGRTLGSQECWECTLTPFGYSKRLRCYVRIFQLWYEGLAIASCSLKSIPHTYTNFRGRSSIYNFVTSAVCY